MPDDDDTEKDTLSFCFWREFIWLHTKGVPIDGYWYTKMYACADACLAPSQRYAARCGTRTTLQCHVQQLVNVETCQARTKEAS